MSGGCSVTIATRSLSACIAATTARRLIDLSPPIRSSRSLWRAARVAKIVIGILKGGRAKPVREIDSVAHSPTAG